MDRAQFPIVASEYCAAARICIFNHACLLSSWDKKCSNAKLEVYQNSVSILFPRMVWVQGPYPCGLYPDLGIARDGLIGCLEPGERVIADSGYRGNHISLHQGD